jgi:Protein of unknown function (DUF3306)
MGAPSSKLCNRLAASSVAVTLLSVLAVAAGAATAQESFSQPPAGDPAPQRIEQGKPADHPNPRERGAREATAPGFDAAALPRIESIDAQTDITVFLRNGVPNELRLAALRRSWTVDPAIRDFKEGQENDWNFNDPDSIPGFGDLGPGVDVKRMVAEILGEAPRMAFAARRTK